ncbi:MAG: hypothetical protein F2752_06285, partial [Actinobacteria bacterium]|nr:hypothetical protein [Actinomycetota bacterium]
MGSLAFNGTNQNATLNPAKIVTGNYITLGFWNYGISSKASSIFATGTGTSNRMMNIHLPWSPAIVYWDAGDGNSYDRINISVSNAQYQGWHYWAFTKDVIAQTMNIYLDGTLFLSGSSLLKTLNTPTYATIASEGSANYHEGKLGVIQMYNRALTITEITQNYNANAGRFGIAGTPSSSKNITFKSAKGARISGVISGGGNIIKTGTDTLILQGTNTFSGTANITTGAVEIKNAAAFGTASGTTTVASGATVQIEGSSFNIPEPITISGIGVAVGGVNQGVIKNIRNQNTWSGAITLAADARIVSGTLSGTTTDSLIITTGGINTGSYILTTDVVKGMHIGGVISGTGGLTKISNDTLVLSGANTYTGSTTLTNGAIEAKNNTAFGTVAGNTSVASGTTIQIEGGGLTIAEPITISGNGVVVGGSNQGAIKNIRNQNTLTGIITLGADATIVSGNLSGTTADSLLITTGGINTGVYTLTTDVVKGMRIDGIISGTGGIKKISADTLLLGGTNTYTGLTILNNGVISVKNSAAFGGTTSITGITTINDGTGIRIDAANLSIPEPFTIYGSGLGASGVIKNMGNINTITGPITMASASIITSAGTSSSTATDSLLITTGGINTGTYTLTTNTVKGMRIQGVISGTGDLTKINTDTLILGGTNTYSGLTTVSAGVIEVKNNAAFGTATGTTTVAAGATVQLEGSSLSVAEPITINGDGVVVSSINQGALKNTKNKNTWTGPITVGSTGARIVSTGSLTTDSLLIITGGINTGTATLTTDVRKGMRIDAVISGSGALTKEGGDSLVIGAINTYTGLTTVSTGVIEVKNNAAFGDVAGATTVSAGATVQLDGIGLSVAEPITINGDGVLVSSINQGALKNTKNKNTWTGLISIGNAGGRIFSTGTSTSDSLLIITGGINTGSAILTADVAKGMRIDGLITGAGGLTKIGTDTLIIGASNNYSGATNISVGVVQLQNQDGLGSTSAGVTGASTTTVVNTAALKIKGNGFTIPETFTINGTGINSFGAINNPAGINTLVGQITLASASTIVSGTALGTTADSLLITTGGINTGSNILTTGVIKGMRIDGPIIGAGGLTKINNDTLILGGANTYSGLTTLSTGVIEAKSSAAFGNTSGATTMTAGTTIQLEGNNLVIPEPITIYGDGVVVSSKNQGAIKNTRNFNKWTGVITLGTSSTILSGTLSGTTADSLIIETGGIVLSSNRLT